MRVCRLAVVSIRDDSQRSPLPKLEQLEGPIDCEFY